MQEIRERARDLWQKNLPCVICKQRIETFDEDGIYTHLLEHRVRFLTRIIQLY